MLHRFFHGGVDEQFLLHPLLAGGCQLGHCQQHGTASVRAGQAFLGRLHHGNGAGSVQVGHVYIQLRKHMHGLLHRVGDIVELQVQKDLMSPCLNFPNNVRAFRIVQLHADFHIRLPSVKLIQKGKGLLLVFKIQCNDNVLCHG